jgi:hypothetical protein
VVGPDAERRLEGLDGLVGAVRPRQKHAEVGERGGGLGVEADGLAVLALGLGGLAATVENHPEQSPRVRRERGGGDGAAGRRFGLFQTARPQKLGGLSELCGRLGFDVRLACGFGGRARPSASGLRGGGRGRARQQQD